MEIIKAKDFLQRKMNLGFKYCFIETKEGYGIAYIKDFLEYIVSKDGGRHPTLAHENMATMGFEDFRIVESVIINKILEKREAGFDTVYPGVYEGEASSVDEVVTYMCHRTGAGKEDNPFEMEDKGDELIINNGIKDVHMKFTSKNKAVEV